MSFTLTAKIRTAKGALARTKDEIPAVVYGAGGDPRNLSLNYSEFAKLFKAASESSLVDLVVDGAPAGKVLLQETQFDPVSDRIIHADLRRIDMSKPITAMVELKFIGESPAVKELGGTLVHSVNGLEVKCLPSVLVSNIEVNLSVLKTFNDAVKVKDLLIPAGMTVLRPPAETVVAKAQPALTEEQIKAMEDAASKADVSKIELSAKKKEEEEPAEGEAAAGEKGEKKEEKKEEKKDKK